MDEMLELATKTIRREYKLAEVLLDAIFRGDHYSLEEWRVEYINIRQKVDQYVQVLGQIPSADLDPLIEESKDEDSDIETKLLVNRILQERLNRVEKNINQNGKGKVIALSPRSIMEEYELTFFRMVLWYFQTRDLSKDQKQHLWMSMKNQIIDSDVIGLILEGNYEEAEQLMDSKKNLGIFESRIAQKVLNSRFNALLKEISTFDKMYHLGNCKLWWFQAEAQKLDDLEVKKDVEIKIQEIRDLSLEACEIPELQLAALTIQLQKYGVSLEKRDELEVTDYMRDRFQNGYRFAEEYQSYQKERKETKEPSKAILLHAPNQK